LIIEDLFYAVIKVQNLILRLWGTHGILVRIIWTYFIQIGGIRTFVLPGSIGCPLARNKEN